MAEEAEVKELLTVTLSLDENYGEWKSYGTKKDADKDDFFKLATEESKVNLAEKLVATDAVSGVETPEDTVARIALHNPGWVVDDWRAVGPTKVEVILIEDPALKSYTYIHPETGRLFRRKAVQGSLLVDEVWMSKADPDLFNEITVELPWGVRVMPPLDTLPAKQVAKVQKYLYRGKGKVQLDAPRDAKPDEMEGL